MIIRFSLPRFLSTLFSVTLTLVAISVTPAVAQDDVPAVNTIPPELQKKIQFLNPEYLVYRPACDSNSKLPLLIFLHGAGGVGDDINKVKGRPAKIWNSIRQFGCL